MHTVSDYFIQRGVGVDGSVIVHFKSQRTLLASGQTTFEWPYRVNNIPSAEKWQLTTARTSDLPLLQHHSIRHKYSEISVFLGLLGLQGELFMSCTLYRTRHPSVSGPLPARRRTIKNVG